MTRWWFAEHLRSGLQDRARLTDSGFYLCPSLLSPSTVHYKERTVIWEPDQVPGSDAGGLATPGCSGLGASLVGFGSAELGGVLASRLAASRAA